MYGGHQIPKGGHALLNGGMSLPGGGHVVEKIADGMIYATTGAEFAAQMDYGTSPDLLVRFDAVSGLADLAGGDDALDAYAAGNAITNVEKWGTVADIGDNDPRFAGYSSTSKFDPGVGSFAMVWLGDVANPSGTRGLAAKRALSSGPGWILQMNPGPGVSFRTFGATTNGAFGQLALSPGPTAITAVFDASGANQYLYANSLSTIRTRATGSLSNSTAMIIGSHFAGSLASPCGLAMFAFWSGKGGDKRQANHDALLASYKI